MKKTDNIVEKYMDIISMYYDTDVMDDIMRRWNEPHRHYHGIGHLSDILKRIDNSFISEWNDHPLMSDIYKAFILAAFFHDIIYIPTERDNEERSMKYFVRVSHKVPLEVKRMVINMIECTEHREIPKNKINLSFWMFDYAPIWDNTKEGLIKYEHDIFDEYKFVDIEQYKEKRIKFLESTKKLFNDSNVDKNMDFLINYVNNRNYKKKINWYGRLQLRCRNTKTPC